MLVAQDLDFDMFRRTYIFFNKYIIITEGAQGFTFSHAHLLFQLFCIVHYSHTFTTATGAGFDQDRVAHTVCNFMSLFYTHQWLICTRNHRHIKGLSGLFSSNLATHHIDRVRARTDKGDTSIGHCFGEFCILTQKSVTRMDTIHTKLLRNFNNLISSQVRLGRRCRSDTNRLVCILYKGHSTVCLGIDGNGLDAHFFCRTHNAQCNFATIGN
ncbi:hypothetical protein D3C86_984080 [compost metagenome]